MAEKLEQVYIENNDNSVKNEAHDSSIIVSVASSLAALFLEESLRERKGAEIPSLGIRMIRTDTGNKLVSQVEH